MMTNTISSFPSAAGSALLSAIGGSLIWTMKKYAATPVTSTASLALVLGLGMAANNALFGQLDHHPAPFFFGPAQSAVNQQVEAATPPVAIAPPPVRPLPAVVAEPAPEAAPVAQPEVSVAPAEAGTEVTNAELANAQRKLQDMGLFTGEIDGFYGPKTAEAIRAFEMRNGMTPKGEMSRPVIDAILRADATDNALINQARNTARSADTPAAVVETPSASVSESTDLVAGQRALQALLSPQAETVAQPANSTESFTPPAEAALPPAQQVASTPAEMEPVAPTATDATLIEKVQQGLASLGFLHSRIDGVAGEETARAIRNFEVFNNYEVTGTVTPELVDLLIAAGADIQS